MEQNYIAQAMPADGAGRNHMLSMDNLRFLAELLAREKGASLASAYAVTPEGHKIDLLRTSHRRTGVPCRRDLGISQWARETAHPQKLKGMEN